MPVLFLFVFRFVRLLLSGHQVVAIENAALRMQIGAFQRKRKRPLLTTLDRVFWITLRSVWSDWRHPLIYVQADTVVRWHRDRFRRFWARLCKPQRRRRGRPGTAAEFRRLIEQMAAANPLWRAPRIHGELKMLGIAISERTVSRILRRLRRPPNQTWRTFLHNHVGQLVSIDFFTVPTITMRVLFVLIVLEHDRRKVLHFNVAEHPTGAWTAQQIVEAFADREAAQYLIRDRDSRYSAEVRLRIKSLGMQEILTAPQSPWQNPGAERQLVNIAPRRPQ
jgi:putative transposase